MTPDVFGADKSQAMKGVQIAIAYIGILAMPPLFGFIAEKISISLLPIYLFIFLALIFAMHELVLIKTKNNK